MNGALMVEEKRLLAAIEARADELTALLGDLVRAPSENPPGDTRAAAHVVTVWLKQQGLQAEVIGSAVERPSLLVHWFFPAASDGGTPGPRLVFLSHLDTVPLGEP